MRSDLFYNLDRLASNSWPALTCEEFGDWQLRASNGVTRRANSVLPDRTMPVQPDWLITVQDFYKQHDLAARFYVSDAAPPDLSPHLGSLGYKVEAPSSVMSAHTSDVLNRSARNHNSCKVISYSKLEYEWLDAFMRIEGFEAWKRDNYREIMNNIGLPVCFVMAHIDSETAGIGMAVVEQGWAGLFNIATTATHRRKGVATRVVHMLAEWAHHIGAENLYLQVLKENRSAISMYNKLGWEHLYSYYYAMQG